MKRPRHSAHDANSHSDSDLSDEIESSSDDSSDESEGSETENYEEQDSSEDSSDHESEGSENENFEAEVELTANMWTDVDVDFTPMKNLPTYKEPETTIDEITTRTEIFLKLFPRSLFMWISECTNQRIKMFGVTKNKEIPPVNWHEIMKFMGCVLVMSYNRVPHFHMYFSNNKALGNKLIQSAFNRERFKLIWSKLYFNNPDQPDGASKTYYMEELMNCLKYTFSRARSESSFQAIDESMVKFKGRTTMKQRMPPKPIKDGVKVWHRCDSQSGYVYDFNQYTGREEAQIKGKLGERVVETLCSTIRDPEVAIFTDRFFTSVRLMHTLPFPCVGTVMSNRINLPQMKRKLKRGESEAKCTEHGVICFKWKDSKEFMLLSNCHDATISTADRRQKDGTLKTFDCPEAIVSYNKYMGGVDLTDQFTMLYDMDRKCNKWWKRTFQRFLMTAVTNAWILYQQQQNEKIPLIDYLVPLSEDLIEIGKSGSYFHRKIGSGRPSKRSKLIRNAGHMPVPTSRRRCTRCALKKIEKRTTMMCSECDLPLCLECYAPYHQ